MIEDLSYKETIQFLKENSNVELSLTYEKSNIRTQRTLQHLLKHKFKQSKTQSVYDLIMSHAISAEQRCATAGNLMIKKLCGFKTDQNTLKTKDDVLTQLQEMKIKKIFIDMFAELLSISSQNTKITMKKSANNNFYLELIEGHVFQVQALLKNSHNKESNNPHLLCIDGYVENVSEIHHLLEAYSSNNQYLALFVRGMHEDVLNTLAVNAARNTLNIHPFKVNFDVESVNTLVDIATVCQGDVVSSTKGDLISSCLNYIMHADKISVKADSVILSCNSENNSANRVREKAEARPEISELLKKRVQSLTAKQIVIAIPDDINFLSNSNQLDSAIRLFSAVTTRLQPENIANEYLNSLRNSLTSLSVF